MTGTPLLWVGFSAFVLIMLALDLGVFNRHEHEIRMREAAAWSAAWITLSLIFGAGVWWAEGPDKGLEFLTGWLVEKALSVDNLFVFLAIFTYFAVPKKLQHTALFWGVFGALVMRAVFIFLGGALLHAFEWIIYVFGAFLVFTGVRLMVTEEEVHPEKNRVLRLCRRIFPATPDYVGKHFFVRGADKVLRATPLFFVLVVVEISDVMFAVDSIPAVFAITTDTFIVYTSNVFAILGLRALYFLLAGSLGRFHLLRHGLSLVLMFVGLKMLIVEWIKIPIGVSLGVIAGLIFVSIVASLVFTKREEPGAGK
jgi:tellurite resistance protein TerC